MKCTYFMIFISKHIQIYPNIFKHTQTHPKMSIHIQTYPNIFEPLWIPPNLSKHIQIYINLSKPILTNMNLSHMLSFWRKIHFILSHMYQKLIMKYNSNLYDIPMCNGTVQDCSRKHLMASLSARHPSGMHLLYDFHIQTYSNNPIISKHIVTPLQTYLNIFERLKT